MGLRERIQARRQQSILPAEVQQYYQSEKRQRRGVAIGLAILALIITVALALGLFFGGRFLFRQIKGERADSGNTSSTATNVPSNDLDKPSATTNENRSGTGSGTGTGNSGTTTQPTSPTANTPKPTPSTSTPGTSTAPAPTRTPSTTPSLGDSPSSTLPHTGDEGQ